MREKMKTAKQKDKNLAQHSINIKFLFVKESFLYLDFFCWCGLLNTWFWWFGQQPNIMKTCSEVVFFLCFSLRESFYPWQTRTPFYTFYETVFIFPPSHLHFFLHFLFTFTENLILTVSISIQALQSEFKPNSVRILVCQKWPRDDNWFMMKNPHFEKNSHVDKC